MTKEYPGEPITIIDFTKDKHTTDIVLNEKALQQILKHPDVKDRNVSVVSIVGSFRKGKSFLLNWLLRFMYATYRSVKHPSGPFRDSNSNDDEHGWLGDRDEVIHGFNWRSGIHRETVGIQFWSDVFLYDGKNGTKNCIILMDTQGMFDNLSSDAENSKLFSLCTLISSLQIYNLPGLIQQDHLQHLHFATAYARLAAENDNDKTFQQLLFLIRDWYYPEERSYGFEGGKLYLDEILEVNEDQHTDLSSVREFIKSSFEKLDCFLMPPPGTYCATKSNFGWAKLDEDFIEQLKELVPGLVAPRNIVEKKFNNKILDASDLYECIKVFVETFKPNDCLPEPQSIFSLTIERSMENLINKCLSDYRKLVELKDVKCLKAPAHVVKLHDDARDIAIEQFGIAKKMGSAKDHEIYKEQLIEKIEEDLNVWHDVAIDLMDCARLSFSQYKNAIDSQNLCDLKTEADVERIHKMFHDESLRSYKISDKKGSIEQQASFRENLEHDIKNEYKRWSEIVLNLQSAINECLSAYKTGIHREKPENLKSEQEIDTVHEKHKKEAYTSYEKRVKRGSQKEQDLFKLSLQEEINIEYLKWKKYITTLIGYFNEGVTFYENNTTKSTWKTLKIPEDVQKHHSGYKRLAMNYLDQTSLAPKFIQDNFRNYLEHEIEKRYTEWSDKAIERIHNKNAQKWYHCIQPCLRPSVDS